jgi:hypothetical protein
VTSWPTPATAAAGSSASSRAPPLRKDDADAAKAQWRKIADQLRNKLPRLTGLLDEAETDVLPT